jgi:hypothetical protein
MLMMAHRSIFPDARNVVLTGGTLNSISGDYNLNTYIMADANNESGQYTFLSCAACSNGPST